MPVEIVAEVAGRDRLTSRSLAEAMRSAQRASPLVVQVALLVAVAFSELTMPRWALVLMSVAVMLSSTAALRFRSSVAIPFVGCYLVIGAYFVAVADPTDPLLGMLFTLTSWAAAVPIMLLGSIAGPLVSGALALAYSACLAVVHPEWDPRVPLMFLSLCLLVDIGSAIMIWQVRRFALRIDERERNLAAERTRAARARALSEAAAEYTSVLHDTIVNTFGALARGGAEGFDPEAVRERCRNDLERVRASQLEGAGLSERVSLRQLERVGLPIRWAGITGDDLRRYEALLPDTVLRALLGCATEAVLNATKHSGATRVVCEASYEEGEFALLITDDGVGFDPEAVSERGIAHSIRARAARNGIRARIEASPGGGTSVRLTCRPSDALHDRAVSHDAASERVIRAFKIRMGATWAAVVTVIGMLGLSMTATGQGARPWAALAAILTIVAISGVVCKPDNDSPRWFAVSTLAVIALSNLLLFSDDSRVEGMFFPSLALTALHTLLLTTRRSRVWFFWSVGVQIAIVAAVIACGALRDLVDLVPVLLLEAPVLALLCILYAFVRLIGDVGGLLLNANARTAELDRQAVRLEAERNVRMQWSAAALDGPLALLQALADGSLSCIDPEVRSRCATEEAYLRQLSAVPADGSPLSWWFTLAIAESRKRTVVLQIDAEQAEAADPRDARAIGELILASVGLADAGEELRVSVVPQPHAMLLLIVGTADALLTLEAPEVPGRARVECRRLGEQVLVETRFDRGRTCEPHPVGTLMTGK